MCTNKLILQFDFSSSTLPFFTITLALKHFFPKFQLFGQFPFMTRFPIETTILLEITPLAIRFRVIISFTLDSTSIFNRFRWPR